MKVRIIDAQGGVTVVEEDASIRTEPDRAMSEREFYLDAWLIEHGSMDACTGPEVGHCACDSYRKALDAIKAEQARREREGVSIEDPDAPTLEERLGPYGIEWELEQRERMGGGG